MKIREIYIENFGKLSEYKVVMNDGLNGFCEENGYGKTTLSAFIKAMLYGLEDTRRQSINENDRKKYTPWQSGAFGGYMTFECEKGRFRVERSFGKKASDDTFSLYNLDTGAASYAIAEPIGETLFGIDADGFERTVFLSEKNLSGKNENQSISAKLSDLVGVEGDIGGFDDAISLLDERRKFYQKKGGSGEIRDTQNRISSAENEIAEIDERIKLCDAAQAQLSSINEKISREKQHKAELLSLQRTAQQKKEKLAYVEQYRNITSSIELQERRLNEFKEFFKNKLPTNAEISEAARCAAEAKRLEAETDLFAEDTEYTSLTRLFSPGISASECDKMVKSAEEACSIREALEENAEPKEESLAVPFYSVPSEAELEEMTAKIGSKGQKGGTRAGFLAFNLLSIILIATGIILGNTNSFLYSLVAIGGVIMVASIVYTLSKKGQKSKDEVADFIVRVYGEDRRFSSELSALMTMKADLVRYNNLISEKQESERRRAELRERLSMLEAELTAFVRRFGFSGEALRESVSIIQTKYQRLRFLEESAGRAESQRASAIERAAMLRRSADSFLTLFPTQTGDPIEEIRRNLAEYDVLSASLRKLRGDAENYARIHGLKNEQEYCTDEILPSFAELSDAIRTADETLISLEREKSRTESIIFGATADAERRLVLSEEIRELYDKISVYESNLAAIQKAKELLAKAKSNMTAKYLDTTRSGFEKYVSLIDDANGEFAMDTSFCIMKNDLGALRQADAYSKGTKDLHALAVRFALVDALYDGEKPPIILDDPFVSFDDKRTEKALALLKKLSGTRQIIYFTCSKSRKVK